MIARVLVDTNVLVYSYDRGSVEKQHRAVEALAALASGRQGAISTQVLGEFVVTVTRKLRDPLSVEEALGQVERHLSAWTVLDITREVVREAVRGVRRYQLHYWDAQLWAVAHLHRIPVVFTEDFSDGAALEGVRFVNPLTQGFRAADWI